MKPTKVSLLLIKSLSSAKSKVPAIHRVFSSSVMDITATPAVGQHINHEGKQYTTIKEGLAYILIPAEASKVPQQTPKGENQTQDVFYNPIQQFNRDLSVLAIKAHGEYMLEQWEKGKKRKEPSDRKSGRDKKRKRNQGSVDVEASRKTSRVDAIPACDENIMQETKTEEKVEELPSTRNGTNEEAKNLPDLEDIPETFIEPVETTNINDEESQNTKVEAQKTDKAARPSFTILDALSATGLRALRYAQEIPFTTSVTANDLLSSATRQIKINIQHNKLEPKINTLTGNAIAHMYSLIDAPMISSGPMKPAKYSVIDLDPYGTAAPFLDAAIQAVQDGGLLCVTCTDAAVWASNGWPEKCFALYGGMPLKGPLSHEAGLRLILHAIATSAARYALSITPLLSLSIDFYARVFVRVRKSALNVKFLAGKTMMVYNCDTGCGAWTTQLLGRNRYSTTKKGNEMWKHGLEQGPSAKETCAECGFKTHIGGPMYAGHLHDPQFIQRIIDNLDTLDADIYQTIPRIRGMLTVALEECLPPITSAETSMTNVGQKNMTLIPPDSQALINGPAVIDPSPFLFMLPTLSKVVHTVTPHENAFRGALRHLGYRVTRSHTKGGCIKTDAPWSVIWRVMRAWVDEKSPIKDGSVRENTAGWKILGLGMNSEEREKRDVECGLGNDQSSDGLIQVVFDEKLGSEKDRNKLVRYQRNPRENWGPMARAKAKPKEKTHTASS
ncbi:N2,N2-dimethylguanosine tRNA methyltransferase [Blumeria hordei DH14]|uniref:tRNA (guanine(26)-N(2))-dimethyltransferase n=1 Tax=Blumeria graminis f. sp. hordei (strain DH14) TaxID=546991 RepID=N1JF50_BLUG1|nr:N2,N2-dimethylguanosine tRNA methyltransferase [Blumeria hordei DH14]